MGKAQKIVVTLVLGLALTQTDAYIDTQVARSDSLLQSGNAYEAIEVLKSLSSQMIESGQTDFQSIGSIYEKIGEIYFLKEDQESSIDYFDRAVESYTRYIQERFSQIRKQKTKIQKIYNFTDQYDQAQIVGAQIDNLDNIILDEGISLDSVSINIKISQDEALNYIDLALSYMDRGLYSQAIQNITESLKIEDSGLDLFYYNNIIPNDSTLNLRLHEVIDKNQYIDDQVMLFDAMLLGNLKRHDDAKAKLHSYLELRQDDMVAIELYAKILYKLQDYEGALFNFSRVTMDSPDNIDAHYFSGMCLSYLGDIQGANKKFKDVLDIDLYYHQAYFEIGKNFLEMENYTQSISYLKQAILLDPENDITYQYLGIAFYKTDKMINALESFERAAELNNEDNLNYYYLGVINDQILENDKAIEYYEQARDIDRNFPDVNLRLGKLLYNNKNYKSAMEPLRDYMILEPDSTFVLPWLGDIFISEGRYGEAIDIFTRIIDEEPNNIEYLNKLGESYIVTNENDKAIECFIKIIDLDEERFDIMYKIGVLYNKIQKFSDAIYYLNGSIDCGNETEDIYYQLALSNGNIGNYMEAIINFEKALIINPISMKTNYQMGVALLELGMVRDAIEKFNVFLQSNESDYITRILLVKCYTLDRQYDMSLNLLDELIIENDRDHTLFYYQGLSYAGQAGLRGSDDNDAREYLLEQAARSYTKGLKIDPNFGELHFELGIVMMDLNRKKEARKNLNALKYIDQYLYDKLDNYIKN